MLCWWLLIPRSVLLLLVPSCTQDCVNPVFLFHIIDALTSWGLAESERLDFPGLSNS